MLHFIFTFYFCSGIIGFIGKAESQEKLRSKPLKSFLLRYSDSEIGGLTIAWVGEGEEGKNIISFKRIMEINISSKKRREC